MRFTAYNNYSAFIDHAEVLLFRASDTDLVAPIMGADGVIATLITPFIEQTPMPCTKDEAAARLVRASVSISAQMGAVSQA